MQKWFLEITMKHASLDTWRNWFFTAHIMTFSATQKSFYVMITHIFPSKHLNHPYVAIHLPSSSFHLSWLHTCLFFWTTYIISFLLFNSFFLVNKNPKLSFHDYLALPYTLHDSKIFSSIVLPIILYKLALTDVRFLKAYLSTSLELSTLAPYLG